MIDACTHDGDVHADEVFGAAVVELAHPGEEVRWTRTRDPERLAQADLRLDVGMRDDPSTGDFDHHQRGGAGERPNGIRYATFGLVWRRWGAQVCGGDARAAARIDERLVQGVDANDTGQEVVRELVDGVRPMSVSGVVAAMLPAWDDEDRDTDRVFAEAKALATTILQREVHHALAHARARSLVAAAIAAADDPRIIELDRDMPWHEAVCADAPEARFVVAPRKDGAYKVQAVPKQPGRFENRLDLPEPWGGLDGPQLAAVTGVEDAVFCHAARFLCAARSREGALRLAHLALDGL